VDIVKILIGTIDMPGYAPNLLANWLSQNTEHEVTIIANPNKYQRGKREPFIPIISNYLNSRSLSTSVKRRYDIGIAPDPSLVIGLHRLRKQRLLKKIVYWRLDYYPQKYFQPLDTLYQLIEKRAQSFADEIWSLSSPDDSLVRNSLYPHLSKVKYVPYLVKDIISTGKLDKRSPRITWVGTDMDNSRKLCEEALVSLQNIIKDASLFIADYSKSALRISDSELEQVLDRSVAGLAIYKPHPKSSKQYADPGRVKAYLSRGIPVIITKVPPVWREIDKYQAGIAVDYDPESIAAGMLYCIRNFETLSKNALFLAYKYSFSDKWIDFSSLFPE
jgi:hypothetical protein